MNGPLILAAPLLVFLLPAPVEAYIGPGAGLSAIGSLLALIATIFLMIVGFIWYPVKRILRRRKKEEAGEDKERQ